eukprot:TRINITY_DN96271_c0_g1_i1.p1 TRINITY_DN96271_c0_g1~~TRINITY_DN96271_c0_g1_i1.p1  ORF type:complete len:489 (-),score=43.13 TRINITY_DN96271_c0_g1_i1:14-1480(-)
MATNVVDTPPEVLQNVWEFACSRTKAAFTSSCRAFRAAVRCNLVRIVSPLPNELSADLSTRWLAAKEVRLCGFGEGRASVGDSAQVHALLKCCPAVETIQLGVSNAVDLLVEVIQTVPTLRKLTIGGYPSRWDSFMTLDTLKACFTTANAAMITNLSIGEGPGNPVQIASVAHLLPNLTALDLPNELSDPKVVRAMHRGFPGLTYLRVRDVTDKVLEKIASFAALKEFHTSKICTDCVLHTDNGVKVLLEKCSSLCVLGCPVTLEWEVEPLTRHAQLKELHFAPRHSQRGADRIVRAVTECTGLQSLHLYNRIPNSVLLAFQNFQHQLETIQLRSIALANDSGVCAVFVCCGARLKSLTLYDLPQAVSDVCLQALAALRPRLTYLCTGYCPGISPDAVLALCEACPHLTDLRLIDDGDNEFPSHKLIQIASICPRIARIDLGHRYADLGLLRGLAQFCPLLETVVARGTLLAATERLPGYPYLDIVTK